MGRDTIQLEDAVSTISLEYLLEVKSGVYTRFFDFANYRIPISQFLFDILRYGPIQLDQCSQPNKSEDWDPSTSFARDTATRAYRGTRDIDGCPKRDEPVQEEVAPAVSTVEIPLTAEVVFEPVPEEVIPMMKKRKQLRRKRKADEVEANAPAKVLRKDHLSMHSEHPTCRGKSVTAMGIGEGSAAPILETTNALTGSKSVSDAEPLSYAKPLLDAE
ncbi:hypothetical protein Tco_0852943 [Tanacetum coccineum]